MSLTVARRIANVLIWGGLVLIISGLALAYPFVRDTLEAQSDPEASLSFVVTLPPAPTQPATAPATSASAPTPTSQPTATASPTLTKSAITPATSTPTPTPPPTATASPARLQAIVPAATTPTAATPTATTTVVPTPAVLPDDSTSSNNSTAIPPAATSAPPAAGAAPAAVAAPNRIAIQAIQLDVPVETVGWHVERGASVWDVPDRRVAGWLKTSAPAGQPGNTVLDGHHNIKGEVFRRLVDLKPGDAIDLYAGEKVYHYAVTEKHILPDRDQPLQVRIANAQWIQPTADERLTLVTCWPYTNNTHRLIIVARPAPSASANQPSE